MRTDEKLIGAAMERKAMLRYTRVTKPTITQTSAWRDGFLTAMKMAEAWLLKRQARYHKRKGGLVRRRYED